MSRQITHTTHPWIKRWVKLREDKKCRESEKGVLIEGKKIIEELIAHYPYRWVMIPEGASAPFFIDPDRLVSLSSSCFLKVASTPHPDGLLAEFVLPSYHPLAALQEGNKWILLDRIQDPGNLGTLLRTGKAFGVDGALLLEGGVDPFNDKVIRASRGALFSLPLIKITLEELYCFLKENPQRKLLIADLEGQPFFELPRKSCYPRILALGNEGKGIQEALKMLGHPITIPIANQVESLNVAAAAALLIYHLFAQE